MAGAAPLLGGVVLCGGRSRRMGRDKALVALGGRTLLERAVAVLASRAPRVALACGPAERYRELGLTLRLDRSGPASAGSAGFGPLAGIEAGLAGSLADAPAGGWVLVLACDLPEVPPDALDRLLARAAEGGSDAVLFETARGPEPLCAAYHTDLLPAVRAALDGGERRAIAPFRYPLAGGDLPRVARLAVPESAARAFERNLNTPADLAASHEDRT